MARSSLSDVVAAIEMVEEQQEKKTGKQKKSQENNSFLNPGGRGKRK